MQIGDEVYIHGYIDELKGDTVIIRNDGGYFGTTRSEVRPNDEDVGKPCYKIYVIAERRRFPNSYYDYFVDTVSCLNYWKKHILYGGEAVLYAKERPFTKSDRLKLGKTVFWTKKEAEEAIGIVYKDEPKICGIFRKGELSDEDAEELKRQVDLLLKYAEKKKPQTDCAWR